MTVAQIMEEIRKDRIFHEDSGGGVTFSGGEPLMQTDFLCEVLQACRKEEVHAALDTCGYAPEDHLLRAARLADLVLFDLKFADAARHRQFTGVSNERILSNLRALARVHRDIWIRIPIIPGINDSDDELDALAAVLAGIPGLRRVSLLPYHATGSGKLARLGGTDRLGDLKPPSPELMNQIARRFAACDMDVHVGG